MSLLIVDSHRKIERNNSDTPTCLEYRNFRKMKRSCYGLTVTPPLPTPPPPIYILSPKPQCDGIWRQDLWEEIEVNLGSENGALMVGLMHYKILAGVAQFMELCPMHQVVPCPRILV